MLPHLRNHLPMKPSSESVSRIANAHQSKGGHESEKSQRGQQVRQPASAQFKAPCLDIKFENLLSRCSED